MDSNNYLSNFGITDVHETVVRARTTIDIALATERKKEKDIDRLKDRLTEKIFGKLNLFFKYKRQEKFKLFVNQKLWKLIKESFYFHSKGVELVGKSFKIPYKEVSSSEFDPDGFADILNKKWTDEETGVQLAELSFIKPPEQEWKDYEGKEVNAYFKLCLPSKD
jgi:hypothetical protein